MTRTLTPDAQYDGVALTIAENGEVWSDADGPAPFETVFQRLVDRLAYAHNIALGNIDWNGELRGAGGTDLDFDIFVGAISSITVLNGSTYRTLATTGATANETHVEGYNAGNPSATALAPSTWHYLYAFRTNGGALSFQISTTVPNALRKYKDGDAEKRYLGCFPTDASGHPLPFEACRGRFISSIRFGCVNRRLIGPDEDAARSRRPLQGAPPRARRARQAPRAGARSAFARAA